MDSCVTAKTNRRVQCKTLSCSAIVSNYKIGDVEYFYAKRGCTADPEASHIEGEQYPADKETVPSGWTGIKQYNQRTSIKNGNTLRKVFQNLFKKYFVKSLISFAFKTLSEPHNFQSLKNFNVILVRAVFQQSQLVGWNLHMIPLGQKIVLYVGRLFRHQQM